tara:strand:+ start:660 stop:833 length:174 start_codon:yes stop_codon:yes gene_type:complete
MNNKALIYALVTLLICSVVGMSLAFVSEKILIIAFASLGVVAIFTLLYAYFDTFSED